MAIFPSDDFNAKAYRSRYSDLAKFDDIRLLEHYRDHGMNENRSATSIATREDFLSLLSSKNSLLEIGAFDTPTLNFLYTSNASKVIHYADWFSRDELIERATVIKNAGGDRNPSEVPEIKWILSQGYSQINCAYDAVVSHHCLEHQPDLIRHFLDVRSILADGGWYFVSLPDKNFCFDHFIPETTIVDLLDAYYSKRKSPQFKSILEHHVFTSHTYFDGINPYDSYDPGMKKRFEDAFSDYSSSNYVDVHCWQFTPTLFKKIVSQLAALGMIPPIDELKVYRAGREFYAAIAFS